MPTTKKTNILFITRAYGQNAGGMERLSYEQIEAVSKKKLVASSVIAHTGDRKFSPLFIVTSIPRALSAGKKADVIHIGDPLLSFTGWVLALLLNKPIAVTVHGLDVTYSNPLYRLYLYLFFRNFSLYLPISKYTKSLLSRWHPHGDVKVLNPGIKDQYFDASLTKKELSKLLNINTANKAILLTVGRLVRRKGHAWFISNVVPKLPKNIIYVIAGTGPEEDNIKKVITKNSLTDQVLLLGRVSETDIKTLFNTADIFIQPNIPVENDGEGFGLVLLEAALCNMPVYTSNIEGMIDAVQSNQNGKLLPTQNPDKWIKTISAQIIKPEAPNVRQYCLDNFSWTKQSDQMIAYLMTVI